MKTRAPYLAAAMLISCVMPALGHHSFAMFDRDKTIEIQGTVKAFQWTNPHSFLDLYVDDQKSVVWTLEFGAVHNLVNQGWRPKTLVPGDKVLVTVHPAKDGGPYGQALTVTLPSGTVMQAVQGLLPADLEQSPERQERKP